MKKISLFGAGGHSFATIELIRSLDEYNPVIVFDDNPAYKEILNVPVEKYNGEVLPSKSLCITIGNNKNRKKVASLFNAELPIFVHDSVTKYPSVILGKGSVVLPNVVLDADVSVGDFCIINNNATVSHNVKMENFVHIAIQVAVAGGVKIGEGTLVGAGSVILPEIKIGKWVTIGAGAVVTKDIPDYAVVYGNPSKIIKYNKK